MRSSNKNAGLLCLIGFLHAACGGGDTVTSFRSKAVNSESLSAQGGDSIAASVKADEVGTENAVDQDATETTDGSSAPTKAGKDLVVLQQASAIKGIESTSPAQMEASSGARAEDAAQDVSPQKQEPAKLAWLPQPGRLEPEPWSREGTSYLKRSDKEELFPERVADKKTDGARLAMGVNQHKANNCMFLSGLAALAYQNPDFVRSMIQPNPDGTYRVRFYASDEQKKLHPIFFNISAALPRDKVGNTAYNLPNDVDGDGKGEIWAGLIEKAMAIYQDRYQGPAKNQGYGRLEGIGSKTLETITGLSYQTLVTGYEKGDPNRVWTLLSRANHGQAMEASCGKTILPKLVGAHAYSVLGTYTTADGKRMVRLRNPWGYQVPDNRPDPEAGRDRGRFALPLDEFMRAYWDFYAPGRQGDDGPMNP